MAEWFTHDHQAPSRGPQPLPLEPLWTLWHEGQRIDASMLIHHDGGVELQLHGDGTFFSGHRCFNRANAVTLANKVFGDYVALGWLPSSL